MNCDNCKLEKATIFYTQVENNNFQKINLCSLCANKKGVSNSYEDNDIKPLINGEYKNNEKNKDGLACDECGFTESDFKKIGRFGCPNCYLVFDKNLEEIFDIMNQKIKHLGKVPKLKSKVIKDSKDNHKKADSHQGYLFSDSEINFKKDNNKSENISELKKSLKECIENENYEEAAMLRDVIFNLNSKD